MKRYIGWDFHLGFVGIKLYIYQVLSLEKEHSIASIRVGVPSTTCIQGSRLKAI